MNILDVDSQKALAEARAQYDVRGPLELVFARQRELMGKYLPLEERIIGHAPSVPVNLDDPRDQAELKQRAWWVAEELGEALDAWWDGMPLKALEEFSDALHFITELAILGDVQFDQDSIEEGVLSAMVFEMNELEITFEHAILLVFVRLTMGMWQLRNKPWKQTQIETDKAAFGEKIGSAFLYLVAVMMKFWDLTLEEVATVYLQKSVVNKFRIASRY